MTFLHTLPNLRQSSLANFMVLTVNCSTEFYHIIFIKGTISAAMFGIKYKTNGGQSNHVGICKEM